ncbi:MAG: ABC transporter ATP-binding protein [Desulfobacterales bacterium]|jgi:biotin transport system ATP-binding protein
MPAQNPLIEMQAVDFCYSDGGVGLSQVSLSIKRGELVVVAGANGSGKTTLLKHFNGLLLPVSGRVLVDGRETHRATEAVRRMVGMVFQHADAQIVGETVYDDVAFGPENLRLAREKVAGRVEAALAAVGLADKHDQRPHLLSGGEKRRLTIAGVLAMAPEVVVFDEPFASLDLDGVRQVLRQIVKLQNEGRTLVVTTHDLDKIMAHADRLVLLSGGRVVRDGHPRAVLPEVERFGVRQPDAVRLGGDFRSWLN